MILFSYCVAEIFIILIGIVLSLGLSTMSFSNGWWQFRVFESHVLIFSQVTWKRLWKHSHKEWVQKPIFLGPKGISKWVFHESSWILLCLVLARLGGGVDRYCFEVPQFVVCYCITAMPLCTQLSQNTGFFIHYLWKVALLFWCILKKNRNGQKCSHHCRAMPHTVWYYLFPCKRGNALHTAGYCNQQSVEVTLWIPHLSMSVLILSIT